MADTTEKVILSVVLDYGDSVKETAQAKTEYTQAKAALDELKKAGKETTAEYVAQEAVVKSLNDSYRQQKKALDDSVKIQTAAKGSISQMRTELSKLTAEYIGLSKAERDAAGGKELLTKIKSTSDELKSLEKAMGDNRRNVGNYASAFEGLVGNLQVGGVSISNLKNGLSGVTDVVKVTTGSVTGFSRALIATPIGLIIAALAGLTAAFLKFQPYVDKLEQVFGGLGQVLDVVIGRLIQVGQGVVAFLSGDFSGGIDKISNSFKGMGDEMKYAYEQGSNLAKLQQEIDDINRDNIITNSQLNKEIDQLLLKARNRTLSERERLKLLDEASAKEKQAFENTKRAAELELQKAQTEYDLAVRNQTLNDAIEDKRANAIAKINDLESQSINLQEKIQNRRDALIQQEIDKRNAATQKAIAEAAKTKAEFDKLVNEAEKESADSSKRYFDELNKRRAEEDAQLKGSFTQRQTELTNQLANQLITQEQYNAQILLLKEQQIQAEIELEKKRGNDTVDLELQLAQDRLAIKQNEVETKGKLSQAEINSARAVAQASQDLISNLAAAAGQGTELQKALALTNVAINLGTAIGNLVATTSAPSPDNLLTGGIAGFVKYAAFLSQVTASIAQARNIIGGAAAGGGSFMTKGPTLLLLGDNPGGVERVDVTPISGQGQTKVNPQSNLVAMAGGGTLTTYGGYAARNVMNQVQSGSSNRPIQVVAKITDINKLNESINSAMEISELK